MWSILKREVKNYIRKPLLWLGVAIVIFMVFQNVSPYLNVHYLAEGETIVNDYPETYRDGDVFDGYVPADKGLRRELWEERIREVLISEFEMDHAGAQSVIDEMKEMDIAKACRHLEGYSYYDAYYEYVDTAYHKGTREEINSYIAEKLEKRRFSYYFSRKFADLQDCLWDFLQPFY
jgi:ABC-2 type transport system permease protein